MGSGTNSGRTSAAAISSASTSTAPEFTDADRAEMRQAGLDAIKEIASGRAKQTASYQNPRDGHKIEAYVEKVTVRDYWGKSTGRKTYTVYVTDETTGERLWYNYGVEKLAAVKDQIRRASGLA